MEQAAALPQTVPLTLIHHRDTFSKRLRLFYGKYEAFAVLSSIYFKWLPPEMHPVHAVVHGDLHIIVFPELECGSREWICKYSCRDRHALQFVSTAVRSHYTQAAMPEQFTELCIQVLPSSERSREREGRQGREKKGVNIKKLPSVFLPAFFHFSVAHGNFSDVCLRHADILSSFFSHESEEFIFFWWKQGNNLHALLWHEYAECVILNQANNNALQ